MPSCTSYSLLVLYIREGEQRPVEYEYSYSTGRPAVSNDWTVREVGVSSHTFQTGNPLPPTA